jgi:hypothetical protein
VAAAFDGPIDVVGDIHGEIDALDALLEVLGYRPDGTHRASRRLVFIGDLCDRGPDSPEVVHRVAELVRAGVAQCLLGNHELNVLRGARKEANGWFFAEDHDRRRGVFLDSRPVVDDAEREAICEFFASMPLVLERPDLRLVHACWEQERVEVLGEQNGKASAVELHRRYARRADDRLRALGRHAEIEALMRTHGSQLRDPSANVPMLDALADSDVHYQMSNPVRVLTSGMEHRADAPYFLAGKWRMIERSEWWRTYSGRVPVLFGHYWRWPVPELGPRLGRMARDPFPDRPYNAWLGEAHRAFCLDFSVGARFAERLGWPGQPFATRLGAVRWPERELLFDDGRGTALIAAEPRG